LRWEGALDNRLRKNEICIVGLPGCGYVFASSPSCFIAYGFNRSALEMEVLRALLVQRRIEAYEASGVLAPAQQVFCQKICSKVIQSQFCIVLLNNESMSSFQTTNANVYMEYGLMLGFNKYIIPFQHDDYSLPFNVAGFDTIKYNNASFRTKAETAIDQAIATTTRTDASPQISPDIGAYLLLRGGIVASIEGPGDKALFQLGAVCQFNLCVDYTGNRYMYFGNFPKLKPSVIAWRIKKLVEILDNRISGVEFRVQSGVVTPQLRDMLLQLRATVEIWILVNDSEARDMLLKLVAGCPITPSVFTIGEVSDEVSKSEMY
jgi:hypothetical protein